MDKNGSRLRNILLVKSEHRSQRKDPVRFRKKKWVQKQRSSAYFSSTHTKANIKKDFQSNSEIQKVQHGEILSRLWKLSPNETFIQPKSYQTQAQNKDTSRNVRSQNSLPWGLKKSLEDLLSQNRGIRKNKTLASSSKERKWRAISRMVKRDTKTTVQQQA